MHAYNITRQLMSLVWNCLFDMLVVHPGGHSQLAWEVQDTCTKD